jgi:hypothetical protein
MVNEIEGDLADNSQVVVIGSLIESWRLHVSREGDELGPDAVWLTPSWLIYINQYGINMQFIRLDSLVAASREGATLTLVDRFDVRLRIRGTLDGLTRLLTEILVRVPWVLSRFDAETERRWADQRQEIITQLDQRRERIQESARPESDRPD